MNLSDYIAALPDSYQKHPDSNNYKLLQLLQVSLGELRGDIEAVQDTLNIQTATGKTLDLYGTVYNQPRGAMTDEQYRYIIMQKVARTQAKGNADSIILSMASAFGVGPSEFEISETDKPCEVEVTRLPYTVLQSAGITAGQMRQIIVALLPVGVKLSPLHLDGTFEFSASADDYNEDTGFGNVEQSIGGYLGFLETNDIDIPV